MDIYQSPARLQARNWNAHRIFYSKSLFTGFFPTIPQSAGPKVYNWQRCLCWFDSGCWISVCLMLGSSQTQKSKEGEASCRGSDYKWAWRRYEPWHHVQPLISECLLCASLFFEQVSMLEASSIVVLQWNLVFMSYCSHAIMLYRPVGSRNLFNSIHSGQHKPEFLVQINISKF